MALNARDTLASRFSTEWRNLHTEVGAIDEQLAGLPGIHFRDNGNSRFFMRFFPNPTTSSALGIDMTIRLQWPEARPVDLLALIPARKLEAQGLNPNYGFPEDFTVSLIHSKDTEKQVASFHSTSSHPIHRGHPFVVKMADAPLAIGLEIHITRARIPSPGAPKLAIIALSEILCFSGDENVAAGAHVEVVSKAALNLTSYWKNELLVDAIAPLGLPEMPWKAGESRSIGWISHAHQSADKHLGITLDLGESRRIDGLRLYPALRPSVDDFPGFGIPVHFRLLGGETLAEAESRSLLDRSRRFTEMHGDNSYPFRFPAAVVRYVKLDVTRLWKPYEQYPGFLALSEIELLDGNQVVSRGAAVTVPERNEKVPAHEELNWAPESLTDGSGPQGDLVPLRRWIEMLDQRFGLETRRDEAYKRMAQLEFRWQRGALITALFVVLLAMVFVLIERIRHRRQLRETRRRIASDLHDDVGSNLGSIQVLSALASNKADNREELDTIQRVAAETTTSVRDIVWLLQPTAAEQVGIVDHLRESAAALLDPLAWTLDSDFHDWRLSDQERRHLALFFREALHNIRHAKASKAEIHLRHDRGQFLLTIMDDGCGIEENRLIQASTLRALRQRAERLQGSFEVKSAPDHGTTVSLRFQPRASGSAKAPVHKLP